MTEQKPKHGGCFDCGRTDTDMLFSVTAPPTPRETFRGTVKAGADSVALCEDCAEKEHDRHD